MQQSVAPCLTHKHTYTHTHIHTYTHTAQCAPVCRRAPHCTVKLPRTCGRVFQKPPVALRTASGCGTPHVEFTATGMGIKPPCPTTKPGAWTPTVPQPTRSSRPSPVTVHRGSRRHPLTVSRRMRSMVARFSAMDMPARRFDMAAGGCGAAEQRSAQCCGVQGRKIP